MMTLGRGYISVLIDDCCYRPGVAMDGGGRLESISSFCVQALQSEACKPAQLGMTDGATMAELVGGFTGG